jgi:hypothetical protein
MPEESEMTVDGEIFDEFKSARNISKHSALPSSFSN